MKIWYKIQNVLTVLWHKDKDTNTLAEVIW
jgi:hypothetical protein